MYINRIRRELGLPERQNYYPQVRMTVRSGGTVNICQMTFI
jgi:hypothetical protein